MLDKVKFFRRRQFVLGPEYIAYKGWKRLELAVDIRITVHPDLPATRVEREGTKAILLGYAIDPYEPDTEEPRILDRFVDNPGSPGDVIKGLEKLTGRFVLLVKCREGLWLFHDAVALRQVHYCRDRMGAVWCASQAELLAELHGFTHDPEVLDYRSIPAYRATTGEFWLMNDRTAYREIRNLLPNHYLDLLRCSAVRYWPASGSIEPLSIERSIELCTPILKDSIKAAAERFPLKMGISAGGDSRKTLAACREVRDKITYFTHTPTQASMVVNDTRVPARLLPKLGMEHRNLGLLRMNNEFRQYYEVSATWAREKRGHIAFTLLKHFGPETTVLNSNISEVAQCVYWLPKSRVDGENLAVISGLNHPLAIEEFEKWLMGARPACEASGMNIMDLFFLEQRMGRWATAAFSEYDITHETFNPYNNRHLHSLMLGINERYRKNRRWDVTIKHILHMWPEVLQEPINPPDCTSDRIQQFIRRSIIHRILTPWLPVYEYLRYFKLRKRFERQAQA